MQVNITKFNYQIKGNILMLGKKRKKFKSYLIRNISEKDWKMFKRWSAIQGYTNLNDTFSSIIKSIVTDEFHMKGTTESDT